MGGGEGIGHIRTLGYILPTGTYFDLGVLGHFSHWDIFCYFGILEHFSIENKTRKIVIIHEDFEL